MRNSILTILVARGCSSKWHLIKKVHNIVVMKSLKSLHRGWPLSRQCEIPWQFHDISLTVRDTPAHVKRYSYHAFTSVTVSGGGRNATVPDMKPKRNPQTQQSQEQTQITINILGKFSLTRFFPDIYPTFSKISRHFTDSCQNPWHFSVFHTSGHPANIN